jgi:hypothetical protein
VTLRYPNASGVSTDSSAVLTLPSTSQPYATATFTGLTFAIPQNTTKSLDVYVNLSTIESSAASGAPVSVKLVYNTGFRSTDSSGTTSATLAAADLNSASTGKGTMYVRRSLPTLSAVALDSSTLTSGSNKAIARVKVTADAAGDVSWDKINFLINKTAAITLGATTTIKLWSGSNSLTGSFATTTAGDTLALGTIEAFPVTADAAGTSNLNLVFLPDAEQTVPAGTSVTYELRATVGGVSAAGGYSLDVSIPNNSTSIATSDAATIGVVGTADGSSFTWSDKSSIATVHSTATLDWTNDYLVRNLPLTVGNLTTTI